MKQIDAREIIKVANLILGADSEDITVLTNVILVQDKMYDFYYRIKEYDNSDTNSSFNNRLIVNNEFTDSPFEVLGYTLPFSIKDIYGVPYEYGKNDFYALDSNGELIPIYKIHFDYNLFAQYKEVMIVNSSNNPALKKYIGRTFVVDIIYKDGSLGYSRWSNKDDNILQLEEPLKIYLYNVIPVKYINKGDFIEFKTEEELFAQYGFETTLRLLKEKNNILSRLDNGNILYVRNKQPNYFTITDLLEEYTVNMFTYSLFKLNDGMTSVNYPYNNAVKVGDKVLLTPYLYNYSGTVLLTTADKSLIQFDTVDPEEKNKIAKYFYLSSYISDDYVSEEYNKKYCLGLGDKNSVRVWVKKSQIVFKSRPVCGQSLPIQQMNEDIISEIKKLTKENRRDVNEGDRVMIRHKENMVNEFGKNDSDEPKTWCRFTKPMEELCGKFAIVDHIFPNGKVILKNWECDNETNTDFMFSLDMLCLPNKDEPKSSLGNKYKEVIKNNKYKLFNLKDIPNGSFVIDVWGNIKRIIKSNNGTSCAIVSKDGLFTSDFYNCADVDKLIKCFDISIIVSFNTMNFEINSVNFPNSIENIWLTTEMHIDKDIKALTNIEIEE